MPPKRPVPVEIAAHLKLHRQERDHHTRELQKWVRRALKAGSSKTQIAVVLDTNPHRVDTLIHPKREI